MTNSTSIRSSFSALLIREGMVLPSASCSERQGSEYDCILSILLFFSVGVALDMWCIRRHRHIFGGQINRGGGADGYSMDVIAVFIKVNHQLSW